MIRSPPAPVTPPVPGREAAGDQTRAAAHKGSTTRNIPIPDRAGTGQERSGPEAPPIRILGETRTGEIPDPKALTPAAPAR